MSDQESDVDDNGNKVIVHKSPSWRQPEINNFKWNRWRGEFCWLYQFTGWKEDYRVVNGVFGTFVWGRASRISFFVGVAGDDKLKCLVK